MTSRMVAGGGAAATPPSFPPGAVIGNSLAARGSSTMTIRSSIHHRADHTESFPGKARAWMGRQGARPLTQARSTAITSRSHARAPAACSARPDSSQQSLKIEMVTRNLPAFADLSSFVDHELKRVGIDASLGQVDSSHGIHAGARGVSSSARIETVLSPTTPMRLYDPCCARPDDRR